MPNRTIPLSQLKDIATVVMHAANADTIEQALQRISDATRELVKANYTALGIPDGEGGLTHFKVSGISDEEIQRIDHPPIGRGLLGAIMHERQPILLDHLQEDPRSSGFPEGHPPMDRFLGVPIQVGEELFGMLYLTDRQDGDTFTQGDQWFVETMAGYAALVIAGVQLRDKKHKITLMEERQRIGMALHDGIIQSLYALGMHLDLIRKQVDAPPDTFTPVINGLNSVIEEIRDYIMNLRKQEQTTLTYPAMLENVVSNLYIPPEMNIVINAPDRAVPLNIEDAESVGMIIREGLSNVVRHAGTCSVTISAWHYPDHIKFVMTDDGAGFDMDILERKDGLGVRNMHERARLHRGELKLMSAVGVGTTMTLTIPTR